MAIQQVVPGVYAIPISIVNAFLIEAEDGLTLIDTGVPDSGDKILVAVRALGRQPGDIRAIMVTHCHGDHSGSLAELKQLTGAPAYMHPVDAALVRQGNVGRPMVPGPGLVNRLLFRLLIRPDMAVIPPAEIECEIQDGTELSLAGGIRAIAAPGHCAGQLVFLWPQHGGVLFAADTASHMRGLNYSLGYEDLAEGKRSLARLARLDFEVACFGHGRAIAGGAAGQFRRKWGSSS